MTAGGRKFLKGLSVSRPIMYRLFIMSYLALANLRMVLCLVAIGCFWTKGPTAEMIGFVCLGFILYGTVKDLVQEYRLVKEDLDR